MQTKKDESYGIIPLRRELGVWNVFLIHQYSKIGKNSYWVFPKGHPESGETYLETAQRELYEETGMTPSVVIQAPTFTLAYSFKHEEYLIEKTVVFFLGIVPEGPYQLQATEVKEAGWFTLDEARSRLDYSDTKAMFEEVIAYLETNQR